MVAGGDAEGRGGDVSRCVCRVLAASVCRWADDVPCVG